MSKTVAYFTMEIGLCADFKTYSGGLGILAGDYAKQSFEENRPITFISILWKYGYNNQKIENGNVIDYCNYNENWQNYVTDTNKTITVTIEGKPITVKIWKYINGDLYMLDTDLDCNGEYKKLTHMLYGGAFEDCEKERICQEIVLGIGGAKALDMLNISPDFYHFNDGHAVFAVHKLLSDFMLFSDFDQALNEVKEKVRFTTHTNVPAGNETHDINSLIHFSANCGLNYDQLKKLGSEPYGMTVAALNSSKRVNAVAKCHSIEANKMWSYLDNIPTIFPIVNGVHQKTWQYDDIYKAYLSGNLDNLFDVHNNHKKNLIKYVFEKKGIKLNKDSLIVGFARRATNYKRWDLIAKIPILLDDLILYHNVQFVFSGKSHSKDYSGKEYLTTIDQLTKKYPNNIVFLEGYDMDIAKILESGSDVWLNTPLSYLEACGTSGMKAALNGSINFSSKDGWWYEACLHGENGWEVYNYTSIQDRDRRDHRDAEELMRCLFNEIVVPYKLNRKKWKTIMYNSMKTAIDGFTTSRMIQQYFDELYI